MNPLEDFCVCCPYCNENIEILIDCSFDEQRYIEDCSVCCRPIVINVAIVDEKLFVEAFSENDC